MDAITRVTNLEAEMQALKRLLNISVDEWVTTTEASKHLDLSRSTITGLIEAAEQARVTSQRYQMKYGEHYRKIPHSSHWQVNWEALKTLINSVPPEEWDEVEDFEVQ